MKNYSPPAKLLFALVAVVIIGQTLSLVDATLGTNLSETTGLFFALLATGLFVGYLYYAYKAWKSRKE